MLTLAIGVTAGLAGLALGAALREVELERLAGEVQIAVFEAVTDLECEFAIWANEQRAQQGRLKAQLAERDNTIEDLEARLADKARALDEILNAWVAETDERDEDPPPHFHPRASPQPEAGFRSSRLGRPADRRQGS